MADLNKVTIIGRLGKDPEIRTFNNGGRVCNLAVATSERWKDKQTGEMKEQTEWFNVAVFNEHIIKFAENLKKGSRVYIEGQQQTRKYTDKDGAEKRVTELVLKQYRGELIDLTGKQETPEPAATPVQKLSPRVMPELDDEVPFALLFAIGLAALQMLA